MENIPPITEWFTSTAALGAVVAALVQFVKPHLGWKGLAVKALALAVGAAAGLVGHFAGALDGTLVNGLVFGVSAGAIAAGLKDYVGSILGKAKAE